MLYLIDGYNLFHAAGFAPPKAAPRSAFDSARARFLDWLATSPLLRSGDADFRVIFDAQNSGTDLGSRSHRGVQITFSYRKTADDLIEEILGANNRRKEMTVISNDARLRDASLRASCFWQSCNDFLDALTQSVPKKKATPPATTSEKPTPTHDDLEELLKVFQQPRPKA